MTSKTLVIVESPAKSVTIEKYLGQNFLVSSSMGHIRDLNPHILSIDIENNFRPHYEELKDKKKIIADLKRLAKKCNRILLAPDPDREGEAIAFHLKEILKDINPNIYRIFFNEITKSAILQAIDKPLELNMNKVNSQQMRRVLDRLAGYKISPILQKKIGGPLSAGRVQSVALKLIVEREKEIQAFEPEEFWTVNAELEGIKKPIFRAKLEKKSHKKLKVSTEQQCKAIVDELKHNQYILTDVEKKIRKREPLPPLITSTLQQEAFKKHGMPVKMTMKIAQELYEGVVIGHNEQTGLITYMRTDSFRVSQDAQTAASDFIEKHYGPEFLPEKPNQYGKKANTQDAHETIRPTLPYHRPKDISQFLTEAQNKIYQLIWERFFSSQMKPALIEETVLTVQNGLYTFLCKGEIIRFSGFMEVLKQSGVIDELPPLEKNSPLKLLDLQTKQNFTKPPSRFTEASLVKILEENGIGRPSTYAKIIETLGKREYVSRDEKRFVPSFLGMKVSDFLDENFPDIMNYHFTADLEKQLDAVSDGNLDWQSEIEKFYAHLSADLDKVISIPKVILLTQKLCPKCQKPLSLKYSFRTRGWFIGCSGYPSCDHTEKQNEINYNKGSEQLDKVCPRENCGKSLIKRYSPKTKRFFVGCSAFPDCDYMEAYLEELGNCPLCSKPLTKKYSPKTKKQFIACSGYPDCNYIEKTKLKIE
jgi:DNA topoisomerase I